MKLGLGLLRPTKGKVRLFGHDPAAREALNLVGYLPELPYFYSHLTPAEALRFYGRLSGLPEVELDQRIARTLERVGLARRSAQRVGEFSKGLRQRLGLAQALLHDPKLLILDEPVSGLDPIAIKEMRDLLRGLREDGKSVFLSSHSISEVENLCDRVAILQRGRLVKLVERSEWKSQPGRLESILVESVTPE
jgi:ABC-2 type transport system ATP-binding protein